MPEPEAGIIRLQKGPGGTFSFLLLFVLLLGLAYQALLLFTPLFYPYRFPIPFAVPIFDTPFALAAIGVGYLCLERHRFRQDFHSAALGTTLWLAALLALAHIGAQPDYPGTPGVNPGVAPYFFFLSYLAGFTGIGLATHYGDRPLPLSDRGRFWVGAGVFCLSILVTIAVMQVRPLLPSLVMPPGRLTPFAIGLGGASTSLLGVWALWGGRKQFFGQERDWFAGLLLLAALIWLLGLLGWLLFPFRYAVSWYVAGLARPVGVGVIFVGLVREQVWLYREARARQRDLEGLHTAGQALVASLDPQQIVETIASKALEVSGAASAILFRLEAPAQVLRPVSYVGRLSAEAIPYLRLPVGAGMAGLAVADQRPVWTSNLQVDERIPLPPEVRLRLRQEGAKASLAIPILTKSGEAFGALAVAYGEERDFSATDVELLSTFGTQASVALENARSFEQLALKARDDEALQTFGQWLLEATGEEAILNQVVRVAQNLLKVDYVALFLFDPKADCLRLLAGRGWEPGTVGVVTVSPSVGSLTAHSFLHKESVQVEDLSQDHRFSVPSYLAAHGVRAGLVVPLGVRDQPVGVMGAYCRLPHRFSDEERRVLLSLAYQTALALEKARLYDELQANLQRLQETQAQLIQADKLKALGTLLSGMAHELNNPLSSILLYVQLLKQQHVLPDPVMKRLDIVEQECERASRIIKDLLIFARRKPPERGRIDLNEVVQAALALQAPELDLNNIRVITELEPTLPEIWADPNQLQQVCLNLFTNAIHAMKAAHGRGVLTMRSSRHGSEVWLQVEDTGPGIPSEHLGRIFDPFFTTKGVGEGSGLGLSLSLGIVEAHGGRMQVENLPGAGARFTVRLPIAEGTELGERPSGEAPAAGRRGRVLVVDDEQRLRGILTEAFSTLGHQVESVATGQEAIASLEQQAFDLIALDLRLPDIDGKEVWRWLQSHHPALASRVVFMTGDTMSPESEKFLQEAGQPVLNKPMTLEKIRRVVSQVLTTKPSDAG